MSTRGLPTSSSHAPKGIDSFLNNFIWRTFKYFDLKMCLLFINDALYDTHYQVNLRCAKRYEYKFFLIALYCMHLSIFLIYVTLSILPLEYLSFMYHMLHTSPMKITILLALSIIIVLWNYMPLEQLSLIHKTQSMLHNVQVFASQCTHLVYPWMRIIVIKYDLSPLHPLFFSFFF